MDIYFEMAKQPVFTVEDVNKYYKNIHGARSAIKYLVAQNKAVKIRNNLYTCISAENGNPIANRFQIASSISHSSYVSHHTAMEYYGITDQVFYEVYVSSDTRFHDFVFDGFTYHFVKSRLSEGIDAPAYTGGIRITDKERSLADCIKDLDKIAGLEELIAIISSIPDINEGKLLYYLHMYNNQFLYQKTGYLLQSFTEGPGLTDQFFDICKEHMGKSKRYLTHDHNAARYNAEWKLVIPENILQIKNGEVEEDRC